MRSIHSFFSRWPQRTFERYLFAILVTGFALVLKLLLAKLLTRDEPALLFFAAIIISAVFGGFGPGLLAITVAAASDEYFFMAPYGTWRLNNLGEALRLAIFIIEAVLITSICARLKIAQRQSNVQRRRAERVATVAKKLQQTILEVADDERRRLGHDLHDGLGQSLTGISLLTKYLQERLVLVAPSEAANAEALTNLARGAMEWTHDLCRTLSPPIEEPTGLYQVLQDLCAKSNILLRIRCQTEMSGTIYPVSPVICNHLYRIAQEAITNAARHGKAANISLRLEFAAGEVVMHVIDDGSGFKNATRSAEGMGLRIMRYRARMIGGSIDFKSPPSGGTTVTCHYKTKAVSA